MKTRLLASVFAGVLTTAAMAEDIKNPVELPPDQIAARLDAFGACVERVLEPQISAGSRDTIAQRLKWTADTPKRPQLYTIQQNGSDIVLDIAHRATQEYDIEGIPTSIESLTNVEITYSHGNTEAPFTTDISSVSVLTMGDTTPVTIYSAFSQPSAHDVSTQTTLDAQGKKTSGSMAELKDIFANNIEYWRNNDQKLKGLIAADPDNPFNPALKETLDMQFENDTRVAMCSTSFLETLDR